MLSKENALEKALQAPWGRQPVRRRVEGYVGARGAASVGLIKAIGANRACPGLGGHPHSPLKASCVSGKVGGQDD